jgi:hypothetical protein
MSAELAFTLIIGVQVLVFLALALREESLKNAGR